MWLGLGPLLRTRRRVVLFVDADLISIRAWRRFILIADLFPSIRSRRRFILDVGFYAILHG